MFYFRADANSSIGIGHIMRCLSIADAARNIGQKITFILADDSVLDLVKSRGYEAIVLHTSFDDLDSELGLWPSITSSFVVIDSYFVTTSYLQILRKKMGDGCILIYIDDLAAFPYPVDVLVNYNAFGPSVNYHGLYDTAGIEEPYLILGPAFAPLRSIFKGLPRKMQKKNPESVFFSTGGSDELHLSLALIKKLSTIHNQSNINYHFLLGSMNSDKEEIKTIASGHSKIVLHEDVTDMKTLISSCDLAVSAAGSTLYEISACGVPLITYSLADNQIPGADAFEKLGLALNIGDLREPKSINSEMVMSGILDKAAVNKVVKAIEYLSSNYYFRIQMGIKMQTMIDGRGADRLVKEVLNIINW